MTAQGICSTATSPKLTQVLIRTQTGLLSLCAFTNKKETWEFKCKDVRCGMRRRCCHQRIWGRVGVDSVGGGDARAWVHAGGDWGDDAGHRAEEGENLEGAGDRKKAIESERQSRTERAGNAGAGRENDVERLFIIHRRIDSTLRQCVYGTIYTSTTHHDRLGVSLRVHMRSAIRQAWWKRGLQLRLTRCHSDPRRAESWRCHCLPSPVIHSRRVKSMKNT